MSSKSKKKTPVEGERKIKLPKSYITRPSTQKLATVYIHPDIAQGLELNPGSFVSVSKESGAGTVALVGLSDNDDQNVVLVSSELRSLCGLLLGDRLQIAPHTRPLPFAESVSVRVEGEMSETDAKQALAATGVVSVGLRVPCKGSHLVVTDIVAKGKATTSDPVAGVAAQLAGLSLEPTDLFVAQPHLFIAASSVKISDAQIDYTQHPWLPRPMGFDSVGGLDRTVAVLRSTVQLPLHHSALFADFGIAPPRGILLHGPPGTGKTMLLRCVAHECGAHVLMVNGPSIVSKYLGETENALREIFAEAVKYQPAIVFMDEIDSLAPKRGSDDAGETESRVVATLLTMMDGMGDAGRVVVVGATNRPNSIDPALRRPGRFDQEVEVGIPDAEQRADILRKQLGRMNRAKCAVSDDDIVVMAQKTHGYVGADLSALCREAVMRAISRGMKKKEEEKEKETEKEGKSDSETIDWVDTKIQLCDLEAALVDVRASAMREIFLEMPKVSWDDIAGQHELKRKLTEVVQLPLEAAGTFSKLGVSAPRGVLLYGPPGCSKTLTAKALASESGLNFLAVKGPEIFNKYVGESEKTVREIFRKARAAAPSIIFFDEIDALASSRDDSGTQASQNVLTSLLNEIDGVEELNGVVVVAATNRPDEIDAALLRPGRLDRHIYVAPPDYEARLQLLQKRCAKFDVEQPEELFERMARATDGCSGAEVALLCQEAGLAAIMENKDTEKVEERHFDHALANISRGITPEMLEYYRAFAQRSGLNM